MAKASTTEPWGKMRIEALSDGVFAIALTLLVLDIRIPDLPRATPIHEILGALRSLRGSFISFVITFVLGGTFWYMHHATFHAMKYVTRGVVMINLLFLMFVSVLPFSTGLLGKLGPNHPIALAVYFTNQLALGFVLNLLWMYAKRHGQIATPAPDPAVRFMIGAHPLGCLAALASIAFDPRASYYGFLVAMLIARAIVRRRYKPQPANAPAQL